MHAIITCCKIVSSPNPLSTVKLTPGVLATSNKDVTYKDNVVKTKI